MGSILRKLKQWVHSLGEYPDCSDMQFSEKEISEMEWFRSRLFDQLKLTQETPMAKTPQHTEPPVFPSHKITFVGGDYKPRRLASGLVGFRAPFDLDKEGFYKLNMTSPVALIFTDGKFVQPGEEIVVKFDGKDAVKAGEVFARAYPLFPTEYDIG